MCRDETIMLHEPTSDGGLGFCAPELPSLLPQNYHGPLIIALDSSILIDLQQHGNEILDGETTITEPKYADELEHLGQLLDLWLLRDIRFIVTPRSYSDAKRLTERFTARRRPTIRALADSLAYQLGEWTIDAPSEWANLEPHDAVRGLPHNADRALVGEALSIGAHVFLSRDDKLIADVRTSEHMLRVCLPSELANDLRAAAVTHFAGGVCHDTDCPYATVSAPAPDIGRWTGLLSIFD